MLIGPSKVYTFTLHDDCSSALVSELSCFTKGKARLQQSKNFEKIYFTKVELFTMPLLSCSSLPL